MSEILWVRDSPVFFGSAQPKGNSRHLADECGWVRALLKAGEDDGPIEFARPEGFDQFPLLLHISRWLPQSLPEGAPGNHLIDPGQQRF